MVGHTSAFFLFPAPAGPGFPYSPYSGRKSRGRVRKARPPPNPNPGPGSPYSPYSGRKSRARLRKARPLGPRRSRAAWRHGGPTRSPSRCGAARQCSHGRRRLLVAGCARSLCMSLAPIVAAAPKTAAASPRHSSRMRGAAAAAPRTSLRPCGRVRPRAERLPARSMPAVVSAIKKDPYSSPTLPTRVGRVGGPWSGRCRE